MCVPFTLIEYRCVRSVVFLCAASQALAQSTGRAFTHVFSKTKNPPVDRWVAICACGIIHVRRCSIIGATTGDARHIARSIFCLHAVKHSTLVKPTVSRARWLWRMHESIQPSTPLDPQSGKVPRSLVCQIPHQKGFQNFENLFSGNNSGGLCYSFTRSLAMADAST